MPSRLNWCAEEQTLLKVLKQDENIQSWKKIAQILNDKFTDSSRTGKQCRDRYINYVRFNVQCPKIIGWSAQEDKILFQKFYEHGAKWVHISKQMPGRSENNLKNRFYGAMRKIMRKIVKAEKDIKPKPKKSIKQKQLIKIFEECRCVDEVEVISGQIKNFTQFSNSLYSKLLLLAVSQEEQITQDQVKNVIVMIHKYNSLNTKSISKRKNQDQSSITGDNSKESQLEEISNSYSSQNVSQGKQQSLPTYYEMDYEVQENSVLSWQKPFGEFNKNLLKDSIDLLNFQDDFAQSDKPIYFNLASSVSLQLY